ncbi:uncharacterized protein LY89DRAFT_681158 [Mollisia scopiformis]|uniref:CST complex subunit Stn1 N-terminal domain-containing protein n=1 Tax=Mollisia scopiformis TaxID=149040 RepID=A0A194XNL0_MOLSC|nr:uncharacterized protein LY89DRAFT_681158 [Mollisia scopiformis]KUJ21741.1 hypothetical protein LY89DRAFT_681158 [Mollisia scopiformis]
MTSALPEPGNLTIYPDYCQSLSPTIGKWVPLSAIDVSGLRDVGVYCEQRKLYHFLNHPVKWVKITGVVVAIDEVREKKENKDKKIFTLDDSSGVCVEVTVPAPPVFEAPDAGKKHLGQLAKLQEGKGDKKEDSTPSTENPVVPWAEIDVGTVIKVKGRVNMWWKEFQVEGVKIEVVRGLDAEVRAWDEVREFRETVLGVPWVVGKEEEERCRKVRERELRRAKKRPREEKGKARVEERKDKVQRGGEVRKRKDLERVQKLDGVVKRRKDTEGESLGSKNKINYPSMAVRKAAAGKYDALGI